MDVLMPQLGETVAEGKISKWFVKAGDAVKPGDNLFEIETDKVSMEVPAISAGTLAAIHVRAGEVAPVGAVVAQILGAGEKASAPLTPAKAGVQESKTLDSRLRGNERQIVPPANKPRPTMQMEPFREVRSPERNYGPARLPGGTVVTPLARRLAGEGGIDLANLKGSGPHGRIVARDVETARSKVPALPQTPTSAQIILTADIQIGESLALCAAAPAIELSDIIIKAWAAALQHIVPSQEPNITLVIGHSRPVIRDVARKSLTTIAAARRDIGTSDDKNTSTAIFIADVRGIASIAGVLQPPQTTMLSMGSPRRAPVEGANGSIKFVDAMTATLTCDHRVVDSVLGAELLAVFKGFVEQPVTMIV